MKIFSCIVIAIFSSVAASIAFAYLFRFPILGGGFIGPVGDYSSYRSLRAQPEILSLVLSNWLTWGVMGNFIAIAVAGVLAALVGRKFRLSARKTFYLAAVLGVVPILFIALYDVLYPLITLVS